MSEKQGLYNKYIVTKADGFLTDPNAQYFVLRIDTDLCARLALGTYAEACEKENPQLAADLHQWLIDVPWAGRATLEAVREK